MSKKIMGIYSIKNKINDKIYIGSSIDIQNRWYIHKSDLIKNKHHNIYLQRAWKKYGEENFEFTIIELVENEGDLLEREQYWLDTLESYNSKKGYNINPTAGSQLGRKLSEKSKIKMQNSSKTKKVVIQFDPDKNIVQEFPSMTSASKYTKLSRTTIRASLASKTFRKGFAWIYKDDYVSNECILSEYTYDDKINREEDSGGKQMSKQVVRIDWTGNVSVWESIIVASKEVEVSPTTIRNYCRKGFEKYNNEIWMYKEDYDRNLNIVLNAIKENNNIKIAFQQWKDFLNCV